MLTLDWWKHCHSDTKKQDGASSAAFCVRVDPVDPVATVQLCLTLSGGDDDDDDDHHPHLDIVLLQIYIFYGTRSNAEFVIHNGFFYEDNAHDRVKIKLGISKSERLYAMKAEVLARAGIPPYAPSGSFDDTDTQEPQL